MPQLGNYIASTWGNLHLTLDFRGTCAEAFERYLKGSENLAPRSGDWLLCTFRARRRVFLMPVRCLYVFLAARKLQTHALSIPLEQLRHAYSYRIIGLRIYGMWIGYGYGIYGNEWELILRLEYLCFASCIVISTCSAPKNQTSFVARSFSVAFAVCTL